jgi:hypothetical protein
VTEYHYHDLDGFAIYVSYFSLSEVTEQFMQLLGCYREFNLMENGMLEGGTQSLSQEDRTDMENKSKVAESTFSSAFRHKFTRNKRTLFTLPVGEAQNMLKNWLYEVEPPLQRATQEFEAPEFYVDVAHCSDRLQNLTSEHNNQAVPALWPYIRKIKYVQEPLSVSYSNSKQKGLRS